MAAAPAAAAGSATVFWPAAKPAVYHAGGYNWTARSKNERESSIGSYLGTGKAGYAVPECARKYLEFADGAQKLLGTPTLNFKGVAEVCSLIAKPTNVLYAGKLISELPHKLVHSRGNLLAIAESVCETAGTTLSAFQYCVEQYGAGSNTSVALPVSMTKIGSWSKVAFIFSDTMGFIRNFVQWLKWKRFEVTEDMAKGVLNAVTNPEAQDLRDAFYVYAQGSASRELTEMLDAWKRTNPEAAKEQVDVEHERLKTQLKETNESCSEALE